MVAAAAAGGDSLCVVVETADTAAGAAAAFDVGCKLVAGLAASAAAVHLEGRERGAAVERGAEAAFMRARGVIFVVVGTVAEVAVFETAAVASAAAGVSFGAAGVFVGGTAETVARGGTVEEGFEEGFEAGDRGGDDCDVDFDCCPRGISVSGRGRRQG